jgi:hypothetical protein
VNEDQGVSRVTSDRGGLWFSRKARWKAWVKVKKGEVGGKEFM